MSINLKILFTYNTIYNPCYYWNFLCYVLKKIKKPDLEKKKDPDLQNGLGSLIRVQD